MNGAKVKELAVRNQIGGILPPRRGHGCESQIQKSDHGKPMGFGAVDKPSHQ
jgi:hypothetical protein